VTKLLQFLRCPEDHSSLQLADPELTARLNEAIRRGELIDRNGGQVSRQIDGGLIRAAGDMIYPIIDQIPVLLIEEAIPLGQISASGIHGNN
jgi:uncharacterized protein YbaR (Trm112 family)